MSNLSPQERIAAVAAEHGVPCQPIAQLAMEEINRLEALIDECVTLMDAANVPARDRVKAARRASARVERFPEATEAMLQDGARAYEHHLDHHGDKTRGRINAMSAAYHAMLAAAPVEVSNERGPEFWLREIRQDLTSDYYTSDFPDAEENYRESLRLIGALANAGSAPVVARPGPAIARECRRLPDYLTDSIGAMKDDFDGHPVAITVLDKVVKFIDSTEINIPGEQPKILEQAPLIFALEIIAKGETTNPAEAARAALEAHRG